MSYENNSSFTTKRSPDRVRRIQGTVLVDWGSKDLGSGPLRDRIAEVGVPFFRTLVKWHEPAVIVLPTPTQVSTTARNRFLRAIRYESARYAHAVEGFGRHQVQETFKFALRSARPSKHPIMQVLVKWFPELTPSLPKPRRLWESQDYWAPMFDAVSLAVTYLHHNE